MSALNDFQNIKQDVQNSLANFELYFDSNLNCRNIHDSLFRCTSKVTDIASEHLLNLEYLDFAKSVINSESSAQENFSGTSEKSLNSFNSLIGEPFDKIEKVYNNLPLRIKLSEVIHENTHVKLDIQHITMKQLSRDLQRDTLIINGTRLVGANVTLNNIMDTLGCIIDKALSQCLLPPLSRKTKEDLCLNVLKCASRTNSGGLSLQLLSSILCSENILLIPVSSLAGSLLIKISVGSFPRADGTHGTDMHTRMPAPAVPHSPSEGPAAAAGGGGGSKCSAKANTGTSLLRIPPSSQWGVRCEVQVSSFFRIQSTDEEPVSHRDRERTQTEEDETTNPYRHKCLEVVYRNMICAEIDPRLVFIEKLDLLGLTNQSGSVTLMEKEC